MARLAPTTRPAVGFRVVSLIVAEFTLAAGVSSTTWCMVLQKKGSEFNIPYGGLLAQKRVVPHLHNRKLIAGYYLYTPKQMEGFLLLHQHNYHQIHQIHGCNQ